MDILNFFRRCAICEDMSGFYRGFKIYGCSVSELRVSKRSIGICRFKGYGLACCLTSGKESRIRLWKLPSEL